MNLELSSKRPIIIAMKYPFYAFISFFLNMAPSFAYHYQCLSHAPRVGIYHGLISQEEARHLIDLAQSRMSPSTVVDLEGSGSMHSPARTSCSAFLEKSQDPIIKAIEDRVAGILACNTNQIESLQVVRYQFGQEYKPHHDYFGEEQLQAQGNNQRKHTFLIYLNALPLEAGGYTVFPQLFMACLPSLGAALYFENMNDEGQVQEKTLHAGAPVLGQGIEKWACNVWVREGEWQSLIDEATESGKDHQASNYPMPASIPHL